MSRLTYDEANLIRRLAAAHPDALPGAFVLTFPGLGSDGSDWAIENFWRVIDFEAFRNPDHRRGLVSRADARRLYAEWARRTPVPPETERAFLRHVRRHREALRSLTRNLRYAAMDAGRAARAHREDISEEERERRYNAAVRRWSRGGGTGRKKRRP